MNRREFIETGAVLAASAVLAANVAAPGVASAQAQDMPLPPPRTTGGKPLMDALMERRSTRRFAPKALEPQVLSDLLWAAFGINRPDGSNKRTAPSWKNRQEMAVYAALPTGLFRYDASRHALAPVSGKDLRALTGKQDFVATAPLNLIYVVDFAKMSEASPEERMFVAGCDSGSIFQNVYLACASLGLVTVVRANADKSALAKEMNLGTDQMVTLAQTVGYPAA